MHGKATAEVVAEIAQRCQVLADPQQDAHHAGYALRQLADSIPGDLSFPELMLVRGILIRTLNHLFPLPITADTAAQLVRMAYQNCDQTEWRRLFVGLSPQIAIDHSLVTRRTVCSSGKSAALHVAIVRKALEITEQASLDPHVSLAGLATRVGVSSSHLARLIREHTGRTFLAHLQEKRFSSCLQNLQRSTLSIKEVASASGYASVRQMERHVRRRTGLTPTAFRADLLNKQMRSRLSPSGK